jgi:voltage-gated potassium channel
MSRRRISWSRPFLISVGLLIAYFTFPADWHDSWLVISVSLVATAAGLGLVGWMMVKELDRVRHGGAGLTTQVLGILLVLLVMSFAFVFFLINQLNPDQFQGLSTRTDALYFTLTTMSTVGYGDVHAQGQLARALVCGLIVFNVVVVASLLRVNTARRSSQSAEPSRREPS